MNTTEEGARSGRLEEQAVGRGW